MKKDIKNICLMLGLFFSSIFLCSCGSSSQTANLNELDISFHESWKGAASYTFSSNDDGENVKEKVSTYINGFNDAGGDSDLVTLKNVSQNDGNYCVSTDLRRIDKVKGAGDFDVSDSNDFFTVESERYNTVKRLVSGSWSMSELLSVEGQKCQLSISRNSANGVEPITIVGIDGSKSDDYEEFCTSCDLAKGKTTKLFVFRMVGTNLTIGDVEKVNMTFPGKVLYYGGNEIALTGEKAISLTSSTLTGSVIKDGKKEDLSLTSFYGFAIVEQPFSTVATVFIIVGSVLFVGLLIFIFFALRASGKKKYKNEMKGGAIEKKAEPSQTRKINYFKFGVKKFFEGDIWKRIKKYKLLYLILLPSLIFLIVFNYMSYSGMLSAFQDFKLTEGVSGSEWVGFKAFYNIFLNKNTSTYRLVRNTIYISIIRISINFPIILIYSVLLRELKLPRFKGAVQTISYIPFFISWIAVSGLAYNVLNYDGGILNKIIVFFGGEAISWYNTPGPWWFILSLASLWKGMGWATLIYLSGMGTINDELYEAVKMDGGGRLRQTFTVTLPALSNVICLQLIFDIASILADDADAIMAMTNGSNALGNTDVIGSSVIGSITSGSGLAESMAISLVRGVLSLLLVLIANKIVKKSGSEGVL